MYNLYRDISSLTFHDLRSNSKPLAQHPVAVTAMLTRYQKIKIVECGNQTVLHLTKYFYLRQTLHINLKLILNTVEVKLDT